MTEFTWTPDFGSNADVKTAVTQVKFGDGYEQRIPQGMNAVSEAWALQFNQREESEATAILTFLKARAGVESFAWTTLDGDDIVVVCRSWSKTKMKGGRQSITATFEQVFEP